MQLTLSPPNGIVDSGPLTVQILSAQIVLFHFGRPVTGVIDERPCSSGNGGTEKPALNFSGEKKRRFFDFAIRSSHSPTLAIRIPPSQQAISNKEKQLAISKGQ